MNSSFNTFSDSLKKIIQFCVFKGKFLGQTASSTHKSCVIFFQHLKIFFLRFPHTNENDITQCGVRRWKSAAVCS